MKFPFIQVLALLSLVVLGEAGWAQGAFTSLRGNVTDQSGAVVPGATVAIENETTQVSAQQITDSTGAYLFPQIAPGRYSIAISSNGFGAQTKVATLLVNQPATVNFALSVERVATTVDVSGEAQTLNDTDATIGNSVSNAVISALPMEGRNVPDLLSLQPGVLYLGRSINPDQDSRSGAVAGARSDQSNVTLDGLDDNDQQNGYAFTGILRSTLDSTEEFRVTTTGGNADAGRSSGAQVTLLTKSGTNQLHGAAYEYNRSDIGHANNWFNKSAELESGLPNEPGKLIRNTFGGSLGGALIKDRLFFFGNYEGQRTSENVQVTQTVPSQDYRNGLLGYCTDAACDSVTTLTASQLSALDAPCATNGVCPWGPGADPNVLQVFQAYPMPNGSVAGDGVNLLSYSFSSPYPASLNTSIFKLDYLLNRHHVLFVRGNLQKDNQAGSLEFPGQPASSHFVDNTKGIAAGETWTISSTMVNDLRYGFIREGNSNRGIGQGDYVQFRFLSQPVAETRTTLVNIPVHNVVDNLSLTKGRHSIQLGGNWRLINNNRGTDQNSYNASTTNPYWYDGYPPTPDMIGLAPIDTGFQNSYQIDYGNLVGGIPEAETFFNYNLVNHGTSGSLQSDGTLISRHFKANEFEYYVQDSWHALKNLNITFGLRHTILQTPYEVNGQQVSPTVDTHQWFLQRGQAAAEGEVYEPNLTFAPSGAANHAPGYWAKQKLNLAPRLALAYSPDTKTSIRAGFGMYFDHFGQGIVRSFDEFGSFGLSTQLDNPAGVYTNENAPRYTGIHDITYNSLCTLPQTPVFPYAPPAGSGCGFSITWGADNHLKTPYSEALDFSIDRELPGGFLLEASYVGRLGRHLLQAVDIAEPVDLADPKSGSDYFTAGSELSRQVDLNGGNANASVQTIPYFEDVFPQMANHDYSGESATQAIYTNEWAPLRYTYGETSSLADLDFYCDYGCPKGTQFWQSQFSSLYAWSSIGMSYYNAGQVVLRHPNSHGLQLDFSYTLSKSIDMGSDTERANEFAGTGAYSSILNSWKPSLNKGVSDFDTKHLVTGDWVYTLPVGRSKKFMGSSGRVVDAIVGGWQWSGLNRWTSGLPFSLIAPGWSTDWQVQGYGIKTANVGAHTHIVNGVPVALDNPTAVNDGVENGGTPMRLPYPGEAGQRNVFRGDGFFDIDTGLSKRWALNDQRAFKFAVEAFNVTNSVRFDTDTNGTILYSSSLTNELTGGSLGAYSSTLTLPRVMQFSLRFDF
ncbi:MAG TPA: carboxypeptidase-like regulatory domain-containing protein [Terracidiphilus sp.]|nr:carboxypeptidase-like regulatory domain-containing protein [Terracidiphilus sp.]